ncbi:MAG: geranylgeranylglyceryl/heptaprenylglyceryl phosphate synthase [Paludibacteraceae bacterium]|nr:geranylgeranylglyceryl/heptaprenylglyceryl phosphate synthase [Paludibacteraceae bacterium]
MPGQLAILIDPDKRVPSTGHLVDLMAVNPPDYVFVGGSTGPADDHFIQSIRTRIQAPVVLFPGNAAQLSEEADTLLLLSLISGRNPDLLIGRHVEAAARLRHSRLKIVPTGYLLIDGGRESTVERVSGTRPIERNDIELAVNTAYAGQLLGMQAIYLEAGSGALQPVPTAMIKAVRAAVSCRLIVGGGLRSRQDAEAAWQAGADVVVVGNHLERFPDRYPEFRQAVR